MDSQRLKQGISRILKVGVQNLKQGVQVQPQYDGLQLLTSPLAEFATSLANFAQMLYTFDTIRVKQSQQCCLIKVTLTV